MKVLVIGRGFIGSRVINYATQKGHQVTSWDLKRGIDIRNREKMLNGIHGFDLVMVFASLTSQLEAKAHPLKFFDTNIGGLFNVLEGCRRGRIRRVMFASSSAVYDNFGVVHPMNVYGTSKLIGEMLVKEYLDYFNITICRFFNTYGPGEDSKGPCRSIVSTFVKQSVEGSEILVYGDGTQRRDFIHVNDAARIALELSESATGTFDVGTGRSISFRSLATMVGAAKLRYIFNPIVGYQDRTLANTAQLESRDLLPRISLEQGIADLKNYYLALSQTPAS